MKRKVCKKIGLAVVGLVLGCVALAQPASAQNIAVKSGEKIAFLGDSITSNGWLQPLGYRHLVTEGLKVNGVDATRIPAGVSGDMSNQMLARLDRDVTSKKPDWMTLSRGVNDVWRGAGGVPLEDYKKNITQIVDKAQAANIKVMVLTSTPIGEEIANADNQKLEPYNDFLHALAKEKNLPLADMDAAMRAARAAINEPNPQKAVLTVDGVHPNAARNMVMATGILRAFGLSDVQLQKAHDAWLDMPKTSQVKTNIAVSMRQYEQLQKTAAAQHRSLDDLVNEQLQKYLDSLLATAVKN